MGKFRRDIRPDAQAFDKIIIETVPRYKTSEMSGDEWRISAEVTFYRKGRPLFRFGASNIEYACRLLDSKLIDNDKQFFGGEEDFCDQEGCENRATVKLKKKFDYCRSGHRSENPSNAYRLFCDDHCKRGDCGLDDADINYEVVAERNEAPTK